MLDDIREWISDNLRYILLGVAGILLILIIVLAVRLIAGRRKPDAADSKTKVEETTEMQTKGADGDDTAAETPTTSAGDPLKRDQKDVRDLVTRFYTARLNQDYDTLSEICEVMDDKVKAGYEAMDQGIEAYNNLMTYSKAGLTPGSYVVFAYFDAKVTGIETLVPTLRGLYLVTNDDGELIVSDTDSHPEQDAYQEQVWTDDDVQALRKDVADRSAESIAQDPDLAAYVESIENGSSDTGSDAGTDADGNSAGDGAEDGAGDDAEGGSTDGSADGSAAGQTGTMYASTGVNVRSEPSTDATKYGSLDTGMQVEVLENLDSGWSHVRYYSSDGTAVEGYVMTQYLTAG